MQLPRKADYALRAVRFLSALPKGELGSINTIAEGASIPRPFLAKILLALTLSGTILSFRGVKGGYRLARPAKKISYLDIIEAINGPLHLNLCTERPECDCSPDGECGIRSFWLAQETSLKKALQRQNFGNHSPKKK